MNLVFDLGAVLFHWEPATLVATHFPEQTSTPAATQNLARSIFGHPDWHGFDRGTVTSDQVAQRTSQRLGLAHDAMVQMVDSIGDLLAPIEGTVDLLTGLVQRRQECGDLRLYFLSNMPTPYARKLERKHAFMTHFDGGIFSCDVQHIKPEAEIYLMLQVRYQLEPGITLMIDDLKGNVQAACKLGWRGITFESPTQLQSDLASQLTTTCKGDS